MNTNILNDNQKNLLDLLPLFSKQFYLAGGTSIALHLGHRESIDFDLFSSSPFSTRSIENTLIKNGFIIEETLVKNGDELSIIIQGVKITFLYYPFNISVEEGIPGVIGIPSLETLGAMKFYTVGRRAKWKDYVDIYFILNNGVSFATLSDIAEDIFGGGYNEKLLREALVYYGDVDYSEEVYYIGESIADSEIKDFFQTLI